MKQQGYFNDQHWLMDYEMVFKWDIPINRRILTGFYGVETSITWGYSRVQESEIAGGST